jgi:adenylate cyclase
MLGFADRSLERCRISLEMAEKRGHPVSLALAHWTIGVLHQLRGEVSLVREHAEACQRIALDQGAPIVPGALLAWVRSEEGAHQEGLEQIEREQAEIERMPDWWRGYFFLLKAQILGKSGRYDEAAESLRKAHELSGEGRIGTYVAELHRLEGVFLRLSSPSHAQSAECALHRALEVAKRQQARMLELRALVSLVELLEPQGRAPEVLPALADLYGWFTEGLDTIDLREARSVLEATS